MNEENKVAEVRRLVAAGRELSDEQRRQLRELQARMDALWERREENQGQRNTEEPGEAESLKG